MMTIGENLTEFAGLPVEDFRMSEGISRPESVCYRVRLDWDEHEAGTTFSDVLDRFLSDPNLPRVKSFVIGLWAPEMEGDALLVVSSLASAADGLRNLEALFVGDITFEEQEISWIQQTDITPLFDSLPNLKTLRVRGSDGLRMASVPHANLREFALESGGLPSHVIQAVLGCDFPALEHLELWLGDSGYGWDGTVELLEPLLQGKLFPNLKYLGLRNSEISDEIAEAISTAPILERLEVLDLSMGTLGDRGADALLKAPALAKLKKLDVHHHYISDEKVRQLGNSVKELNAGDKQEPDDWGGEQHRYVAVAE